MKIKFLIFSMIIFITLLLFSPNSIYAASKSKQNTYTHAFVSSDGEVCSAKVISNIYQEYTTSGTKATYKKRSYWIGLAYVATNTIPSVSSIVCKYVDSNNNTVKTFTWSRDTSPAIYSADIRATWKKYNTTSVKYSKSNKKYLSLAYVVGNSNYILTPFVSKQFKLALKVS